MTGSLFGDLYNPNLADDAAATFEPDPPTPAKRVATTSIEAYRDIQDSLPARENAVLVGLRRYRAAHRSWPTSYELFRSMSEEGAAFDLNAVRPRLTALHAKGRITRQPKRICRITAKSAYTWAVNEENER